MKNFSNIINDKDIITVEYQKNNAVLFSESQTLTDDQKNQARSNIGLDSISKHGYTELTDEDLNTITEVGWYRAAANNTCTNKPTAIGTDSFILIVDNLNDTIIRQVLYYGTTMTNYYSRYSANAGTSWTTWNKQTTINNYSQTFIGRKTFGNGIDLSDSLRANGVDGSAGQILTASGGTLAPKWVDMPTIPANVVQYTSQSLTEEEKSQARTNIGAGTSDFSGDYNDLSNKPTIPTNYVTTDTAQSISAIKTFTVNQRFLKSDMDISKASSTNKYSYIAFDDANSLRAGVLGGMQTTDNYCGTYLQARNGQQIRILSNAGGNITKTHAPTPPNNDDAQQIATTWWVRENYQATCYAGRDSNETGTMYFKVASYTTVANYDHVSLIANLQDIDTPVTAQVVVHCSTATSAYKPNAYICVPTTSCQNLTYARYYAERLFVVANYTIGTASWTFELWLKTTDKNAQTIFNVVSQNSRKGTSKNRPWTLYNNITTASGTTDFSEESSDGRLVANDNYPYAVTVNAITPQTDGDVPLGSASKRFGYGYFKGSVRIYHDSGSIPDISMVNSGLVNGTNPTSIASAQIVQRADNNTALTAWRGYVHTSGYTSSHLYARSFGTEYSNYVAFYGKPNATANNNSNIWYFAPSTSNNIDLGASGQRWLNGYITNLQNCKVINGGGGNSMIQQDSDTAGADILVGSTGCPLKLQGKEVRPVYRQRTGSYSNIALQSDIPSIPPIPFDSTGLSTGTLGSTKLPSTGRYYIECDHVTYTSFSVKTLVSCVVDFNNAQTVSAGVLGYGGSGNIIYYINVDKTGIVTIYARLDNVESTSGTFKYKKLD